MPTETVLEQRLSVVEAAVAELQRQLPSAQPGANWFEQVIGSFKDEPAFEEVLAYGRAFHEAERSEGDPGA